MWLGTLPLIKNEKTLFTIDRQDMEATYMSIGRRMDKKAMVHIHNGIFSY